MKSRSGWLRKLMVLGALIAFAPIATPMANAATAQREEVFFTRLFADTVAVTRGTLQGGVGIPSGIQNFSEPAISGGLAHMVKIRNRAGEIVGFGIQQEVWTPDENGRPRPEFETTWTLVIPGRGTLFLRQIENPTALFTQVRAARAGPQPWSGSIDERTTIGPGPGGVGIIVGGTDEFEGRRGTFIETNQFTALDSRAASGGGATSATSGAVGSTTLTLTYAE